MRLLFLPILLLLNSCSIWSHKDYYSELPKGWKEIVVPFQNLDQSSKDQIYKINGLDLKKELLNHEKAMVLLLVNYCPSNRNLKQIETDLIQDGYTVFKVMFDYNKIPYVYYQDTDTPFFVMDSHYYNAKGIKNYAKAFTQDLTPELSTTFTRYEFHKGHYVSSTN